ncbi:MAG: HAD-IA family hydrolase [bacterium]
MLNPQQVKLIAFDLFGVIISEGHMVSHVLMPLLPETTDKSRVKSYYNDYTLGRIDEAAFWQGINQTNNHPLRHNFLATFKLDPDMEKVINHLRYDYLCAILSNLASDWADTLDQKFSFSKQFSPMIISGKVKAKKPDFAIYQHLIQQSGIKAENIAFIDDRLENLQSAQQLGMSTIHYQREADYYDYRADITIHRLAELIDYFPKK